jgi:site-specific DNA-methyltransferase (adenine-specific)
MVEIIQGDCLEQMQSLNDNSVDSIVTDPPYGIKFMAKRWDHNVPDIEIWQEALRVLKPGGHLLCACGTRTQHRMVVNIEDAGFEIRDVVTWMYGSGFPKSLNISKAIDKAAGVKPIGIKPASLGMANNPQWNELKNQLIMPETTTDDAKQWEGWGTALKPACEFFTLARKPISEKTIAENVLKWGTGGINIDDCRVGDNEMINQSAGNKAGGNSLNMSVKGMPQEVNPTINKGRFPANLIHDGSQEVLDLFPQTKGCQPHKITSNIEKYKGWGSITQKSGEVVGYKGEGSAARFFYCPKASKKDRDEGLEEFDLKVAGGLQGRHDGSLGKQTFSRNTHPTVKPTALMRYLCRLITPPNGVVLDPYMGSGSTGKAAIREGFGFVGIEIDEDYHEIAKARVVA